VVGTGDKQMHIYDLTAGSKITEYKSPLQYQTRCISIFHDKYDDTHNILCMLCLSSLWWCFLYFSLLLSFLFFSSCILILIVFRSFPAWFCPLFSSFLLQQRICDGQHRRAGSGGVLRRVAYQSGDRYVLSVC
jgi:hypothetical protein